MEQRPSSVNRMKPDAFPAQGVPVFTAITASETAVTWSASADTGATSSDTNPCNGIIRWYDPVTGRWLSNDPIGISGGLNQYVFCANNPVNFVDPLGTDVYKINERYTTWWAVDTPDGGITMFHYSGRSWNDGSGGLRVLWNDQAEVARFTTPEAFIQQYHPDMSFTPSSIRALGDKWGNRRNKTSCDEDKQILQKFTSAFNNQDNLRYNAFGLLPGFPNCSSFGENILTHVLGPIRAQTGIGPRISK